MSALTSIFNFLYVYLRVFSCFIFGGSIYSTTFFGEQKLIFDSICESIYGSSLINPVLHFESQPILILVLCVFALGSIIGLVRRLMR